MKKGDNLSAIARRNGISLSQLKSWNGLSSNRIGVGKRLIVGRTEVVKPATDNKEQAAIMPIEGTAGRTGSINQYYRVRKGDTLGKIAHAHGIQVAQLQTWNGLKSTRIGVGDQLIVGMKEVVTPISSPVEKAVEYGRVETSESAGSDIISSYLKKQFEKTEERQLPKR